MFTSWNGIRIIRLVLGGAGVFQGISTYNNILTAVGVLLLIQGIFNAGCCGTACAPAPRNNVSSQKPMEEIQFEEIK